MSSITNPSQVEHLSQTLRGLAVRYAEVARDILGENLTSVILFGSVARGEPDPQSDIDLFIICRSLPKGAFRRRAVLDPVRERLHDKLACLWKAGIYTDFVEIIRTEDEARRPRLLYLDMTEEAILFFDRDSFFAGILDRLRYRLRELGAQRKQLGMIRYWDLKPDFRLGEVIEL